MSEEDKTSKAILLYINGERHELHNVDPRSTLLEHLRSASVGLYGTKLACGEGGCGACTVMVSSFQQSQIKHYSVNACLAPLCSMDGKAVTTIEGLGGVRQQTIDPISERIADSHGSQCGFCTPGIVMATYAYMRAHPEATQQEMEEALDGNLCRCTGYRPILDAIKSLVPRCDGEAAAGICPSTGNPCNCSMDSKIVPTAEFIFPSELQLRQPAALCIQGPTVTWHRPLTLQSLLALKQKHLGAKICVGNTEIGIETRFKFLKYPHLISTSCIQEMNRFDVSDTHVDIGASVPLNDIAARFRDLCRELPEWKVGSLRAVLSQLRWFAGNSIRNVSSLGGNIATASPISDLNPVWVSLGAVLTLASASKGQRKVPIREFFLSYRKVALEAEEVILSVCVPLTRQHEFVRAFKQARRRDDDIAIVSGCFRVLLDEQHQKVLDCGIGFGGMAPKTVPAPLTESLLQSEESWIGEGLVDRVRESLAKDVPLQPNAPGGMAGYRRTLTTSFFQKFHAWVLDPSSFKDYHRGVSKGSQTYTVVDESLAPVTYPIPHVAAKKQATGEAVYCDDIPQPVKGLYAHFVMSSKAHAKVLSVDPSEALKAEGVVAFFGPTDIEGENQVGHPFHDEELFASNEVNWFGHPLGIVVATTHNFARFAARLVKVEYEDLPVLLTIEDAEAAKSYLQESPDHIYKGDVAAAFAECEHIVEGEMSVGAQEHFYLEPQTSFAQPGEGDELVLHASTQNPSVTQMTVSSVLNIAAHKVVVKVKRMGGGFGGKETRSVFVSCACALAAKKLNRPVRMVLDRDVDFQLSGTRHAFRGQYKVGLSADGKFKALDLDLHLNAGNSMDLSFSVMDRALFHSTNAYYIPNVRATGYLAKTNIVTGTAFRGFGGPQGMLVVENWLDHMSKKTGIPVDTLRKNNFLEPGNKTHYNQVLDDNCHIVSMYDQLVDSADYKERCLAVTAFNSKSKYRKRGIYVVPTVFGMSFTAKFMNQAGALVHIYQDGSVQVHHGGTEMGQGLHSKMCQIAAAALEIPVDRVHIMETATDKVANTSPTAASVSSDINGAAVLAACEELRSRLDPVRKANPEFDWPKLCHQAHLEQVNLTAQGFYKTPDIANFDFQLPTVDGGEHMPFNYHSQGVVCSEVELDCLTGDFHILRTDILMDVGKSINPAIDIGQIEGAFVQGVGWCTMEELVWFPNGAMFTRGPGAYKIPGFSDIPIDFRVSLLANAPNPRAVHRSKGVGEPPFFLSASVFFALKDAIYHYRKQQGLSGYFRLDSPATCERLRMACEDDLTNQFKDTQTPHKEFVFLK